MKPLKPNSYCAIPGCPCGGLPKKRNHAPKTYRKIDLYFNGDYLCSTNQSRTCRDAVKAYLERISRGNYYNTLVDSRILKRPDFLKARFNRGES